MDGIFRGLIWLGERVKPYKGPFLGAGLASGLTAIASSFYDYFYRGLNPLPAVLIPLVISSIFLFCWVQTYEKWYQILDRRLLRSRFKNPKIAILSVSGIDEMETKKLLRSTVYTPEDWYNRLCSNDINAEKTIDLSMKKDCSIILNPFGELYPEEDTTNLRTFQKIKEYIKNGGVFVNTAGLAFYYMWNPKTKIEGLTGPLLETYKGRVIPTPSEKDSNIVELWVTLEPVVLTEDSPLTDTWLYKNFGVRTTLGSMRSIEAKNAAHFDIIDENTIIQEFRSALRCETAEAQLIPIIRSEYLYHRTGRKHECYPIAAVKYGRGYLIHIGMVLKKEEDLSLVIKAIKKIIEGLCKEGKLF
jgi:hypothetical protein